MDSHPPRSPDPPCGAYSSTGRRSVPEQRRGFLRQYLSDPLIRRKNDPTHMALATLITLTDIQLAYGHHPLLDHADFAIQAGERIGLIGRNGAGKSSLLRLLDGRTVPDDGDIARSSGLRVATVEQEPELDENATVFDVVCNVDGDHEDWQRPSRVRAVLEKLGLPADIQIAGLSGGTRKRVAATQLALAEARQHPREPEEVRVVC